MKKWFIFFAINTLAIGTFYFYLTKTNAHSNTRISTTVQPDISFFKILEEKTRIGSQFDPVFVSLQTIFQDDHSWTATLSADRVRTLVVTGDILTARDVNNEAVSRNNFVYVFSHIAPILKKADLTYINLETPLLSTCALTTTGMIFCGSEKHTDGLISAGVDVASLANNHMNNHGLRGIKETQKILTSVGIAAAGVSGPVYKDVRGVTFAFLAYNDIGPKEEGIAHSNVASIKQEIQDAKTKADIIVMMPHWGVEYHRMPHPRQREYAHMMIDEGVDLVVGNHPHWYQPIELYKNKFIMYAHGNTIFDQMWSEETKKGVLGVYTFYDAMLIDVEFIPTYTIAGGESTLLEGAKKSEVLQSLYESSTKLAGQ